MFCQSLALGLLGSRVAYAIKKPYTLVYIMLRECYCTIRRCAQQSLCEFVLPFALSQLVKMIITLEPHGIFLSTFAYILTYACKHCIITGMRSSLFGRRCSLSISPTSLSFLLKMLITLDTHIKFGSKYV